MNLGLGTAVFGMNYASKPRISEKEVRLILERAQEASVKVIDTAHPYGNSEEVLGKCWPTNHKFQAITKTPSYQHHFVSMKECAIHLKTTFLASLKKMKLKRAYGLLIHHAPDLMNSDGEWLIDAMEELRSEGKVEKIGVSVYSKDQIEKIVPRFYSSINIIQVPINVLDQRLIKDGYLMSLKRRIEIHGRSVFLQGLLFQPGKHTKAFHEFCGSHGMTPLEGALQFFSQLDELDAVIVGVHSLKELEEVLAASSRKSKRLDFSSLAMEDEKLLDPRQWAIV